MARGDRKRTLNVLDLFSGIGGFALGVENAGIQHEWLGFSEIDKYATELYKRRFPNAKELGSVENVSYKKLKGKRLDLLTGGFPCQAFSIAGNRRGFEDTRGTMFFEIARILRDYIENGKPIPCILLENVKGLLSHDNRRTFTTIYKILTDLNYTIECQLVNTKWWLPQNRERIFIFGRYNGNPSGRKVFPVYGSSEKASKLQGQHTNTITARYEAGATGSYVVESKLNSQKGKLNQICNVGDNDNQANRVYDINGISKTLTDGGGGGAKTGLYRVEDVNLIAKKRKYNTPKEINHYIRKHKDGTIGEIAKELDLPKTQVEHYFRVDNSRAIPSPDIWRQLKKLLNFDDTYDKEVTEIYEKEYEFESSKRVYSENGISQTLNTGNTGLYKVKQIRTKLEVNSTKIRKLTPIECERLQGFPDNWTEGQSDTQRYKQCGNAVSVCVTEAIFRRIYEKSTN